MIGAFIIIDVGENSVGQGTAFFGHKLEIAGIRSAQRHVILREDSGLTLLAAREVNKHQPAHALSRLAF